MADNSLGLSGLGPAGRFLESSGSLVAVRVNADGTILAANAQAIALTGLPLVGEPWNAMLLNFAGKEPFREWLASPARPRLLSVRTTLGLPQTLVDATPFAPLPHLPVDELTWAPILLESALAAALVAVGLVGWRRRDILST